MNTVDAIIVVITILSSLFGLWRGLIKEVLSLVTWVAALVLARLFSESAAALLAGMIDNEGVRYVVGFTVIFVVVMLAGSLLTHVLTKLLSVTGLRLVDRLLGALFGFLRGVIIVLVALFIVTPFASETDWWQNSVLIPEGLDLIERSRLFIEESGALDRDPVI